MYDYMDLKDSLDSLTEDERQLIRYRYFEDRTQSDISGIVRLRIKYLGYPTLWVRSLFN